MTPHPHRQRWVARLSAAFAVRTRTYRSRSLTWRLLAPTMFVLAGTLFVTSMVSSRGTDLRAGQYDDLDGLANRQANQLEGLRASSTDLTSQVDRLTEDLASVGGQADLQKAKELEGPAGLSRVYGPAVTITLDDAPKQALDAAGDDLSAVSDLLVHQQDIQAVANALWAGGAEAMTIQDQRVVSTTGIKCVGNVVILHGVPYSPPYRISAIGPIDEMLTSVTTSPYIQLYLQVVEQSGLGWDVATSPSIDMPGYTGTTDLEYARPAA
ncbi:MAG: DUF881 domain-containing protein [Nocardioidaceae bacterium]